MVTSQDVSALARVSRATVSHVINKTGYVSPELAKRVEAAVKQLNYRPNAIARSLAARRTHTVGVSVACLSSAFYPPLLSGLERTLSREGYSIMLCDSHEDEGIEENNLRILAERRVDGIIWVPCSQNNVEFVRKLAESGRSIVVMDRRVVGDEFDTVMSANKHAGYIATKYLLDRNFRRIAIVTFSLIHSPARERYEGYLQALAESGIAADEGLVCVVDNHLDVLEADTNSAIEKIAALLRSSSRPQAIFACTDSLTASVVESIRKVGLRIPSDIAVLGFDRSPWSAFVDPPISVVAQQTRQMGIEAAKVLLRNLKKKKQALRRRPVLRQLQAQLLPRQSCGEAFNNTTAGGPPKSLMPSRQNGRGQAREAQHIAV
jgi:LacI family transcriptional regulator